MFKHVPVLCEEVLESFGWLKKGSLIVDGTLGRGGHSKLLLSKGFNVIGIDRDIEAINEVRRNLKGLKIVHGNFSKIKEILDDLGIKKVDGILLDLGISTPQLEDSNRGFGFKGKLDMRMDKNQELDARRIVNKYSEDDLIRVLNNYGEKVYCKKIAKEIVRVRERREIETGEELVEIVGRVMPENYKKSRKGHWATPTFRALRIEVNQDFENLKKFLEVFDKCLRGGGVLQIITFHTMEDKIVRMKLRELKQQGVIKLITKKPILANRREILKNVKAKRARLWIVVMK